ncbi:porin [Mucilaginibacter aquatilis]|uniref:Outer membrane beta-barrel protein n=1 Tax=Mucilaginibacter aquatilis TaxID=1517760 RepID=A0A6I4I784_9SPHI|nr:porin [Mucilaginibacter aquatilis]MVN91085.1 outer membrane beta-barrel protein [Mucilaginibacter aquatilis]
MTKKLLLAGALFAAATTFVKAQDTSKVTPVPADPGLTIFGSVDTYYKMDFAGKKNSRIATSFANEANSVSIGMIDLGVKKKYNKALFVGELSFGPRGQGQSIPNADFTGGVVLDDNGNEIAPVLGTQSFHVQNLYVGYDLTDKLNVTAGYMSTFVGYEVISPVGNFNYSTSYLFTNGPFQNAGLKFTYAFTDKVSLMAGIFNDSWNNYTSSREVSTFGGQLMVSPVKGWTAYLNVLSGKLSGTEFDVTTSYQVSDAFKLGLNAATFSAPNDGGGFSGAALYPQYAVSNAVTLGLRAEYFKNKGKTGFNYSSIMPGDDVKAFTLTANVKAGGLTFIPEVRLDNGKTGTFQKLNGQVTKNAGQFVLAAVYAF